MPNCLAVRQPLTALNQTQICAFGPRCRFVPPTGVYELLKKSLTSLFRGFAQLHVLLSTCNLPGCQWVEQGAAAFHQLRCCGIAAMSGCRNAAIRFRRFACCAIKAKPCVPLSTDGIISQRKTLIPTADQPLSCRRRCAVKKDKRRQRYKVCLRSLA